jgi:hypothetical protein
MLAVAPLMASIDTAGAQPVPSSGTVEPCVAAHGDRDTYLADLAATGWAPIPDDGRASAIAKLADAYLPVIAGLDLPLADLLAGREISFAFWMDLAEGRSLLSRGEDVLLLAGFRDDNGDLRVECWTAGPESPATEGFFQMIGQVMSAEGFRMAAVQLLATSDRPATDLFVIRMEPQEPILPPLAATDGLRTRITIPPEGQP